MAKEQSSVKEKQRTGLKEPRRYKVTIYNDDFTTMEFVVKIIAVSKVNKATQMARHEGFPLRLTCEPEE